MHFSEPDIGLHETNQPFSGEPNRFLGRHRHTNVLPCILQYGSKLEQIAHKLGIGSYFRGCFSKDKIPRQKSVHSIEAFIVNLQSSNQGNRKGTHWVVLLRMPNFSIYIDPMGIDPPIEVIHAARNPLGVSYQQVQSIDSCQCGYFCVYFLYCMLISQLSLNEMLAQFDQVDLGKNDHIINQFFCKHHFCIT